MKRWMVSVMVVVGLGCGGKGSDDAADGANASSGSQTSASDTGTPGLECEDLLSEADCMQAVSQNDLPCEWQTFRAVQREGDVCTDLPGVSLCVELNGWTTAAGCGSDPNCEELLGEAHYRPLDGGGVLLTITCGGSSPTSFTACETVLPDVADPPECACACPTFPDAGSDSGSTG